MRAYHAEDRAACLAVFDANIPASFDLTERAEFEAYLDDLPGPYLVAVDDQGTIRGCGGWARGSDGSSADLCWGMVDPALHRRGWGRELTSARIADASRANGVRRIRLQTSQDTEGFYQRLGFVVVEREADGFRPGFDRLVMERVL